MFITAVCFIFLHNVILLVSYNTKNNCSPGFRWIVLKLISHAALQLAEYPPLAALTAANNVVNLFELWSNT